MISTMMVNTLSVVLVLLLVIAPAAIGKPIKADPIRFKGIKPPSWGLTYDSIEVLGFSKEGKVAYVYTAPRNECGDCPNLYIKDLKDDRVIDELHRENSPHWSRYDRKKGTWSPVNVKQVFSRLQIREEKSGAFHPTPAKMKGDVFDLQLREKGAVEVWVHSAELGEKKIGEFVARPDPERAYTKLGQPVGFVESPLADWALAIVAYPERGFEDGQISIIRLETFGVLLTTGFKKR